MSNADSVIEALHAGHAQLAPLIEKLGEKKLTAETFPGEWDVSQVISHLGSGAVITRNILDAALTGHPNPGWEASKEIWAVWDAMSPIERRDAYPGANEQYLALLDSIDDSTRETVRIDLGFLPAPVDLATATAFRLNEFAFHSWDIRSALDPAAVVEPVTVESGAVPHLLELVPSLLGFAAKPDQLERKVALSVTLTDPGREFALSVTDHVQLGTTERTDGELVLPAEAWLRLVTGRLRPEFTPPAVTLTGPVTLDDLRSVFPGF